FPSSLAVNRLRLHNRNRVLLALRLSNEGQLVIMTKCQASPRKDIHGFSCCRVPDAHFDGAFPGYGGELLAVRTENNVPQVRIPPRCIRATEELFGLFPVPFIVAGIEVLFPLAVRGWLLQTPEFKLLSFCRRFRLDLPRHTGESSIRAEGESRHPARA